MQRVVGIGAVLVVCLTCAPPAWADPLPFTISGTGAPRLQSTEPAPPISPGFVGASIDYCSIARYNTGAKADRVLAKLLASLAPDRPVLRVGGDGPGARCGDSKHSSASAATTAIATLAHRLRAKLILGVNLQAHRTDLVRREVTTLLRAIDPRRPYKYVQAVEIGNEPDLYPRYGPDATSYTQINSYFSGYLRDFSRWSAVARRVARDPSLPIAGPSLGRFGLPWITGTHPHNLATFLDGPARPQYLTFHSYPLFRLGDPCPAAGCPSIENLLLDSSSHGLAEVLAPFVPMLPYGGELRVDEMNSVTIGGMPGVSDTFASALWALDTLFEMAQAGVDGVNFHTYPGAAYELFSHPSPGKWFVHPVYYGLLTFARAAPAGSHLLRVAPDFAVDGGPNVKVWATRGEHGKTRLVIINKDSQVHEVVLQGPALPVTGTAAVQRLQAPPDPGATDCPIIYHETGLCATGGATLGGETFGGQASGAPEGDRTSRGTLALRLGRCSLPGTDRSCVLRVRRSGTLITMPAGSAAMLIGSWAQRRGRYSGR